MFSHKIRFFFSSLSESIFKCGLKNCTIFYNFLISLKIRRKKFCLNIRNWLIVRVGFGDLFTGWNFKWKKDQIWRWLFVSAPQQMLNQKVCCHQIFLWFHVEWDGIRWLRKGFFDLYLGFEYLLIGDIDDLWINILEIYPVLW